MRALAAALVLGGCASVPATLELSWLNGCYNDGRETWRWQQDDDFWRMRVVRADRQCNVGMCEFYVSRGRDGVWRFEYVESEAVYGVYRLADLRPREAVFIGETPRGRPQPDQTLTLRERDGTLTIVDSTWTLGPMFSGHRTQCPQ